MFVIELDDLDPREGRKYVYNYNNHVLTHGDEVEHAEVYIEPADTSTVPWPTTTNDALVVERTFAPQRPKRIPVSMCVGCAGIVIIDFPHTHVCRGQDQNGNQAGQR